MSSQNSIRILVTGGAGFIGTHLVRHFVSLGHEVSVIDLKDPEARVAGARYLRGDVRDAPLLSGLVAGCDVVYHLAAMVSVSVCQKDPIESYSNNFTATLGILEAVRREREKGRELRLFFASTAALYGAKGDDGRALVEQDIAERQLSFYGSQKLACEQAIAVYHSAFGLPSLCFRFFNVYGPGQDTQSPYSGVITVFAELARRGAALPLNDGGYQTRDFISVHDLVVGLTSALSLPAEALDGRAVNLGTGSSVTIRQLAELIRDVTGGRSEITKAPPREGDVRHSRADIARARTLLGFQPVEVLRTALVRQLQSTEGPAR